MSVADLHDLELVWPSLDPTDVIVTGTFDQWASSTHLVKGDVGFSGTVKAPWGQKVAYKFIVDGHWQCRDDRPQEDDGLGNMNNVLRTPEKPLPRAHDPPARLSIPLESVQNEGYGDIETMVTAVEFLPPAESATGTRGFLLPIPQITVQGLGQTPLAGTPVSETKVNTAAATEGHVSPASETLQNLAPFKQAPSSCDISTLPVNDNGSALPSVNGSREAHDSQSMSTQLLETGKEILSPPLESIAPQPSRATQATQDTPGLTDHVHASPAQIPATVSEPTVKQPQVDLGETAAQGQPQATSPASTGQTSVPSTPTSSTVMHKKRRSLLARIKHIFDKNKDKQGIKENKH